MRKFDRIHNKLFVWFAAIMTLISFLAMLFTNEPWQFGLVVAFVMLMIIGVEQKNECEAQHENDTEDGL